MRRCAFLSAESLDGHVVDDELAVPHMERDGWRVETVSWRAAGVEWSVYDLVVIRSTWDYHLAPAAFLDAVEAIDAATRLRNPLPVIRWNIDKRYLAFLAEGGIPIVPTIFKHSPSTAELLEMRRAFGPAGIVIKPSVGASAYGLRRLRDADGAAAGAAAAALVGQVALIQPYVPEIQTDGELSLFYFGGRFSHAIRKRPRPGDFRVQEEHGGRLDPIDPDPPVRAIADATIEAVPGGQSLLYARVDLVRFAGGYRLMELELIEPALYLRMDSGAPAGFAHAVAVAAGT